MAAESWNKIDIPRPGAVSTVRIPFTEHTGDLVRCFLEECAGVLKVLQSDILHTEIMVLYSVLYVMNNPLRQHKPFRAVKQVERCLNRLKQMKLTAVLLEVEAMCPKEAQRQVSSQTGQCEVPSQPMLEWLSLKVLGASKLLASLLDCCTRAFSMTRQHLFWAEYIVLNLVLSSMLSRLWVFFQGVLRNLDPLYQAVRALLQDVCRACPMPSLGGFVLPGGVPTFLGASCWAHIEVGLPVGTTRSKKGTEKGNRVPGQMGSKAEKSSMEDLGSLFFQRGPRAAVGDASRFDVKALLRRGSGNRNAAQVAGSPPRPGADTSLVRQKRRLVKELEAASCSSDMDARLTEAAAWCRHRRLRRESCRLKLLRLSCGRLRFLEEKGFRVEGKLLALRRACRKALFLPPPVICRPSSTPSRRRRSLRLRARFRSVRWRRWSQKRGRRVRAGTPSVASKVSAEAGGGGEESEEEDAVAGGSKADAEAGGGGEESEEEDAVAGGSKADAEAGGGGEESEEEDAVAGGSKADAEAGGGGEESEEEDAVAGGSKADAEVGGGGEESEEEDAVAGGSKADADPRLGNGGEIDDIFASLGF
ncbi:nucleolus and neural progenitor protein [Brienomyrus brachyistius]|uniref:nucleolus and neural progenitor protein n=1 Tax=Brienomyrus brachyistius TaxID=42636 RepID=UPI0020B451F7|nr:nucleolus and neural progenitor protein [Brienomyrus brachyistius]